MFVAMLLQLFNGLLFSGSPTKRRVVEFLKCPEHEMGMGVVKTRHDELAPRIDYIGWLEREDLISRAGRKEGAVVVIDEEGFDMRGLFVDGTDDAIVVICCCCRHIFLTKGTSGERGGAALLSSCGGEGRFINGG
jgi:hypothetical protein